MQSKEVEYKEIRIGKHITREEFIQNFPNVRSLPLIIDNDTVVGGYNQLLEYMP